MTKMAAMPIYGENQEQIESPVLLNGKICYKSINFNGGKLAVKDYIDRIILFMK